MSVKFALLYENILIAILSEWISVKDLCYLDCAYCNSDSRNYFLSILTKCSVNSVLEIRQRVVNEYECIRWIAMRRLTVKRLDVWGNPDLKGIRLSQHLDFLCVFLGRNSVEFVVSNSLSVNTLKVTAGYGGWKPLESLLRAVRNVRFLDLHTYCDSSELSSIIVSLCPSLSGIKFRGSYKQMVELVEGCPNLQFLEGFRGEEWLGLDWIGSLQRIEQPSTSSVTIAGRHFEVTGVLCHLFENGSLRFLEKARTFDVTLFPTEIPFRLSGKLLEFRVRIMKTSDSLIHVFKQSPLLRLISLICCVVSDDCMTALVEFCPAVEVIVLYGSTVSKSGLSIVCNKCPLLGTISLKRMKYFHDFVTEVAVGMDSLVVDTSKQHEFSLKRDNERSLKRISWFEPMEIIELKNVLNNNPSLVKIVLNFQSDNCDSLIADLAKYCPLLTSVSINIGAVENVLQSLSSLASLTSCTAEGLLIQRGDLHALLLNKPHFQKLSIPKAQINDDISIIGSLCPSITHIDLSYCKGITNRDVNNMIRGCTLLEVLNFNHCSCITLELFESLTRRKLRYLNIFGGLKRKDILIMAAKVDFSCFYIDAFD